MQPDEQEPIEPETYELRASPYYGGSLRFEVRPDPHPFNDPDLVLIWAPYEGGGVELEISRPRIPRNVPGKTEGEFEADYDEAVLMRDALTKIIEAWPAYVPLPPRS